jgi:hypothetical protein
MFQAEATRKSLRGILLLKGLTLYGWANENGYSRHVVTALVSRYVGKNKRPMRGMSLEVIEKLERDTGIKLCG